MSDHPPIKQRACECAATIRKHDEVQVVSHIDADGLTAAAIMCHALNQLGIEHDVRFVKQLDKEILEEVADANIPTIFTDLGSGMLTDMPRGMDVVIADHHQIDQDGAKGIPYHLNPHLFGIDGSTELSGAGCAYLLAQALRCPEIQSGDLADLAVVGAVGDLQARKYGKLVGCNREILKQGSERGVLNYKKDISFFGKQTREVFRLLVYSSDPYIPGLTGNEAASIEFLRKTGISSGGERWRRWIDLTREEQQKVVSSLIQHCISRQMSSYHLHRLITEVYTLCKEKEGTEMRDASEYSTLLNATARYGFADVGLAVCLGDRDKKLAEAHDLLAGHRKNLVEGLKLVREQGITKLDHIQYFDAGSAIRDTIVGIVAGMSLSNSKHRDTADALGTCAASVGGTGGGHNIAAGATIPRKSKNEFLELMDTMVGKQVTTGK
ncbi:MAG: DHH family phosphoesterase [Methanosarcinales archaeon]|nr:MAG: DHH family phosphoesterase [Methanosarcinales archaeon]